MKKTLCMLLITAMLLSLMPLAVSAAPTGTEVSTLDELKAMKNSGTYYLANDITITGEWNFLPGSDSTPYRWENATLDGNGYTIYYADGTTVYGGLVREANNITIKNLNIVQLGKTTYIGTDNGGEVSPLIRRAVAGTVTLTDISVYANIEMTSANGADQGGGIVAQTNGASLNLTRCVFSGSITKSHTDNDKKGVGGLIGGTWNSHEISITECINYANITSATNAGGFLGSWRGNAGAAKNLKIMKSVNYGNITASYDSAGGFVGFYALMSSYNITFRFNVNYGDISASTHASGAAGGMAGRIQVNNGTNCYVQGCVNFGALNGKKYAASMIGEVTGTKKSVNAEQNFCVTYDGVHKPDSATWSNASLIETNEETCSTLNSYFASIATNPYTLLPNGALTLSWAKEAGYTDAIVGSAKTAFVGAQLSGTAADATRNVRFVGGIKADMIDLDEVGVMIIATFGDGQRKVFEGETATVYESILADGQEILAVNKGVDYFYTAVIEGVPTSLENVTFEVFTYQLNDGAVAYSASTTLAVNLAA